MATTPRKTAARKTAAAKPDVPQTGADILSRVKPKRRTESIDICLATDLIAEFQEADAELNRMRAGTSTSNRMNPGSAAVSESEAFTAQAKVVRALEKKIRESMVTFTFEAMNKDEWRAMLDNHPPRKNNQMDHVVGYDRDTVIDEMVRTSLVTPVFEDCVEVGCNHDDCGTWQQLVQVINPAEWGELRDTANEANSAVVEAPFSLLASQTLDRRGTGSR